jgi:CheY-like chemotaxis protein
MPTSNHILVVDDEPVICAVCARILTSGGNLVDTASSGTEGYEKLGKKTYNFCVLDIKMPGMSGIELYGQICRAYPNLIGRVLFITGDTLSGNISQFLKDNSLKFLTKPFTPNELKDTIHSMMI